jgi:Ca2+-binding RTX toxin-like protein
VLDGGGSGNIFGVRTNIVSYEHAPSAVTVDLTVVGPQNTIGAGFDTLSNFEGIRGSAYDDILTGNGSSVLEGGDGNDHLIGQAGHSDTASYEHAAAGVSVNLALTGAQVTHGAGTDTLTNIANLSGSQFNDVLTGDTHDNILFGNGDHDVFVFNETSGGIGHDTIGDFVSGSDHIELDYAAFDPSGPNDFNAWYASHVSIVNGGGNNGNGNPGPGNDLLIDLDPSHPNVDTILLKNASISGLHANDFIINPGIA